MRIDCWRPSFLFKKKNKLPALVGGQVCPTGPVTLSAFDQSEEFFFQLKYLTWAHFRLVCKCMLMIYQEIFYFGLPFC